MDGYVARQYRAHQRSSDQVATTIPREIKPLFLLLFRNIEQFPIEGIHWGFGYFIVKSQPQMNLSGRERYDPIHLHTAPLALVDALEALRRHPDFARIAESIVDVGYAVDLHLAVNMAVAVDVNVGVQASQLVLKLRGAKNRIEKPLGDRNRSRHQIDTR